MISRRNTLIGGVAGIVVAGGSLLWWRQSGDLDEASFEVTHTEEEWRQILTEKEFAVLREEGTEEPFSSPLNEEVRPGIYSCAGCSLEAYSSEAKFKSGTGWPSFYQSLPEAVRTKPDRTLLIERTEVHCRRCGGHLGHIFDDGPEPTGKRHCLNGVALDFETGEA